MKSLRKMLGSGSIMGKPSTINTTNTTNTECPICYELLANEPSIETPCNHNFHRRCLRTWCNTNFESRCPICRTPIVATCNTLNQEPPIIPPPIIPPPIIPGPIQPIQPAPVMPPPIQPANNIDYGSRDYWDPIYIESMIQNHNWEPVFYDTWIRTGRPIFTNHVTYLDVSELGDMIFSDGHTVQLDIERICNGFPNLRVLELKSNNLTHIPACIGNLRNLEILDLEDNDIPANEVEAIFADPYWNNKSVTVRADNVPFNNNNLPYRFFISNHNNLRSNNTSNRSRVAPQNAGRKRRTNKRKCSTKRRSRRRKYK